MSAIHETPFQCSLDQMFVTVCLREETKDSELEVHSAKLDQTTLQLKLLSESIEPPAIRDAVQIVFSDLLRLLDFLRLLESSLPHIEEAQETLHMLELVHVDARAVVNYIGTRAMHTGGMPGPLLDTLDGITFAVGHDLHRV